MAKFSKSKMKKKPNGQVNEQDEEYQKYTGLVVDVSNEFIDLFSDACNSCLKSKISETIHHQRIRKILQDIDMSKNLTVDAAHCTFKRCYGWRTWIHAPEEGVRGLIRETITLYYAPLKGVLEEFESITKEACVMAIEESKTLQSPKNEALKNLIEEQALETISDWKNATWEQLSRNLHAELEFPAPERFRKLKASIDRLLEQESMKQAERMAAHYQHMLEVSLNNLKLQQADIRAMKRDVVTSHAILDKKNVPMEEPEWTEFYMGWLDKQNRFGRWQRRWFAISAEQKRMWYFGNPEEQPARGAASLEGCTIVPESESGNPLEFHIFFSFDPTSTPASSQVGYRMLNGTKTKSGLSSMTLKANSLASKKEWVDMLARAAAGNPLRKQTVRKVSAPLDEDDNMEPVGRKISTKVFPEEPSSQKQQAGNDKVQDEDDKKRPQRRKTLKSHGVPMEDQDLEEEQSEEMDEEEKKMEELLLFDEIMCQANSASPTDEEAIMLECVTAAVREYMLDCQENITEQASKIIADGMLPMLRSDELHESLLNVLLPEQQHYSSK